MIQPHIHRFETVDSTNDVALAMARDGASEGTVVTALLQTKGRGRRGRAWFGAEGESVLMSIVLRPQVAAPRFAELSFVASLSVAERLQREGCENAALKWPNDVLANGRKIAGILIETTGEAAIVGVGVNVNQRDFPKQIRQSATSLMLETGSPRDVERLSEDLARDVLSNYELYRSRGFEEILRRWEKYMWGAGCSVEVLGEGYHLQGRIAGVDSSGALLVIDEEGKEHSVVAASEVRGL